MLYPFVFKPIFQERIWGGRALERLYEKRLPPNVLVGESWEISDRPEAQSEIANGPLAGKTLRWLMENHERELLGRARSPGGRFPLLVKILDANDRLSLQVHPPRTKARLPGAEAKTEMWYITEARPGAELYVGLRRGVTREQFREKTTLGTVAECFHRIPVAAGDAMFLPSGRVHAIGGGLVLFEIQENSDTTYRVFDWNRVDAAGRPRTLHVQESLECIDFSDFEPAPIRGGANGTKRLVDDPLFTVDRLAFEDGTQKELVLKRCAVVAVIEGRFAIESEMNKLSLEPGTFCLLPASLGRATLQTQTRGRVLIAFPGE